MLEQILQIHFLAKCNIEDLTAKYSKKMPVLYLQTVTDSSKLKEDSITEFCFAYW